jgi:hypothetical protein
MAWYRAGTVTVTNGSATVTGAGTDFVSFASSGDAFRGPDGRTYEIARVVSATELALAEPYLSGSSGGQQFAIQPTQSYIRDLALNAGTLLATFGAVRDGIGQGLIGDGTGAAPGIRFVADQDTGLRRPGPDVLAIVIGGADRVVADTAGVIVAGRVSANAGGTATHRLVKPDDAAVGSRVLGIGYATNGDSAYFTLQGGAAASGAATNMWLNAAQTTGRSINAGGTINASGADYAEYMTKAAGCGTIAPGDVCGVDKDGHLTRTWADAIAFVVKSTDPAYVGGDTWAAKMPPRPTQPGDAVKSWDAALEAERVKVDRVAFCGQVPVNITGTYAVGDYLIAAANGSGIKAVAVKPGLLLTLEQYQRRIGKVWAVRDGRAWVDVQHG